MARINTASFIEKCKQYMESPDGKRRVNELRDRIALGLEVGPGGAHTPEEAAEKFCQVLNYAIASSGLSEDAVAAISGLEYGKPFKIGEGQYKIIVYFANDLRRISFSWKEDYLEDLASLLNDGVDHTMERVWGDWHDRHVGSRTVIPGAHFMEQAIVDFMGNYAYEYNVISVTREESGD